MKSARLLLLVTLALSVSLAAFGQGKAVSGKVSDEKGEPLPGATLVSTDGKYALTDADGSFSLGVASGQTVFGIEGFTAKAVTSVAVIVLNYVFSKLIVFRNRG